MLALDNEQEVLAERQKIGVMEVAAELELATVVRETQRKEAREEAGVEDEEEDDLQAQLAKKHAEFRRQRRNASHHYLTPGRGWQAG